MKNLALRCLTLLCIAYPLAGHATIYKCTIGSTVIYQDVPCTSGPSSTFRQEPFPPSQLQSTSLALGMSDTEVLNMRGWGRPHKITRSKASQAWREEWIYSHRQDEQRLLQFENGKLASIL